MVFDFFKKKKKDDPLDDLDNLVLSKMKPGYLVDYDDKTYTVTGKNYYQWEEGGRTDEWELKLGSETFFLERSEEDGEVEWSLCRKLPLSALEGDIAKHIIKYEDPPETVICNGVTFHFEEDDIGQYFKGSGGDPLSFVVWDFCDESGEQSLSIEQWGETKFDVALGFEVEEYQFTNILPAGA
ncbi:MAG: DUF4178 domain-containing protein [Nitrospinales bacterium]